VENSPLWLELQTIFFRNTMESVKVICREFFILDDDVFQDNKIFDQDNEKFRYCTIVYSRINRNMQFILIKEINNRMQSLSSKKNSRKVGRERKYTLVGFIVDVVEIGAYFLARLKQKNKRRCTMKVLVEIL